MRELALKIKAVAPRRCTVLIGGETGTGKELVARHIHAASKRAGGPFIPVDCSTLPQTLFESQMFGHIKGAFTGADHDTLGFIRAADGGTLFLDEVGELPLAAQAKLLRCLQERAVVPVGSAKPVRVNVRIVAATHRDLSEMVGREAYRQDLYYRLNVAQINTPPLRERVEDIPLLVEHFLAELAELYDEPTRQLAPDVLSALACHVWPGNIRELSNAIEHAYIFCQDDVITRNDLPATVTGGTGPSHDRTLAVAPWEQVERDLIARALQSTHGNQTKASELVGIERHRLRRKIVRYGLEELTQPKRG